MRPYMRLSDPVKFIEGLLSFGYYEHSFTEDSVTMRHPKRDFQYVIVENAARKERIPEIEK